MYELSIIIPIYNIQKLLPRCVDSLIKQSVFEMIEIILVDDGSSDGGSEICDNYARLYKNIIALHKENGGVSSARNYGLKKARGTYIAFVDADDYVVPDFYENMLNCIKLHQADLVISDYFLTFPNEKNFRYRRRAKPHMWNSQEAIIEFLKGGDIGVNLFDKLFVRRIIGDLTFDENIRIGEDLYFIFQYLTASNVIYGDFTPGYHYVQREGSAMNTSFSKKYFDVIDVSERIVEWIKKYQPESIDYAEAMSIHSAYKTLERGYKANAISEFENEMNELSKKVHRFSMRKAWKSLSRKQFLGLALMRFSPKLYVRICKLMKI